MTTETAYQKCLRYGESNPELRGGSVGRYTVSDLKS